MNIRIDTNGKSLIQEIDGQETHMDLYSKEAFEIISHIWLKVGWNEKYPYTFSWMGRPIIQNPEDMIRAQEAIYRIQPDVIIETGVAHGGSIVFYASLCKGIGKGRVIGVDIEVRPHNRRAIEAHELFPYIAVIEGSSIDPLTVKQVKSLIKEDETVMIFLDSNHTKRHVLAELEAYHGLVSIGSYIVATDGSMKDLYDVPRGLSEWSLDNPAAAAKEFVLSHPEFMIEQPTWPFNESQLSENITHWPDAWMRRVK